MVIASVFQRGKRRRGDLRRYHHALCSHAAYSGVAVGSGPVSLWLVLIYALGDSPFGSSTKSGSLDFSRSSVTSLLHHPIS